MDDVNGLVEDGSGAGVRGHHVRTGQLAGATADEVRDTLIAVAPIAGEARLVEAAPALAMAIGYDIDAALEAYQHSAAHGEHG